MIKDTAYKNILFYSLGVLLIFTPIARGAVRAWSSFPVLLAIYSLIILWLLKGNDKSAQRALSSATARINKLFFFFFCIVSSSFIFSVYKHDSLLAFAGLCAYLGLFYLLLYNFEEKLFEGFFVIAIFMGACLSLYGLLQYFEFLSHSWWMPRQFLAATYVNHNHFAGYLELIIPMAICYLLKSPRLLVKLALVIMIAALILTQSRGSWFSLSISLLVMAVILMRDKLLTKKKFIIFTLAFFIIVLLVYPAENRIYQRLASLSTDILQAGQSEASLETRFKIWQGALAMIKERPLLGFGIGNFDAAFYKYRPEGLNMRALYAHNEYLHMAAESGILALILMICILMALVRAGFKKQRGSLAYGCAAALLSLSLHGLTDFNFHIPANMLLFTLYAAYIVRQDA
ncbi:MAG: O-antigen ligase family protein [Candidatus Omnitrophota bacterium]